MGRRSSNNGIEVESEGRESEVEPPVIRRTAATRAVRGAASVAEEVPTEADAGSTSNAKERSEVIRGEMEAAIEERINQERERDRVERDELVWEWSGHIARSMKSDNPTYLDLIDVALVCGHTCKNSIDN